jgi:hypothetical protein
VQTSKKFLAFDEILRFINVFTRAQNLSYLWKRDKYGQIKMAAQFKPGSLTAPALGRWVPNPLEASTFLCVFLCCAALCKHRLITHLRNLNKRLNRFINPYCVKAGEEI